jgi:hypothetical protein
MCKQIVHEVMHAIAITLDQNIWDRKEPYYELTPVSEIGFDFEVAVSVVSSALSPLTFSGFGRENFSNDCRDRISTPWLLA